MIFRLIFIFDKLIEPKFGFGKIVKKKLCFLNIFLQKNSTKQFNKFNLVKITNFQLLRIIFKNFKDLKKIVFKNLYQFIKKIQSKKKIFKHE